MSGEARRKAEEGAQAHYFCPNKKCKAHAKEFPAMLPSEARKATGRSVTCGECGTIAVLRRIEDTKMSVFTFTGAVYFRDPKPPHALQRLDGVTLTIKAPSLETAQRVLDHYGMESLKPTQEKQAGGST